MCGLAAMGGNKALSGFSPMAALLDRNKKGTPASRGAATAASTAAMTPGAATAQPKVQF